MINPSLVKLYQIIEESTDPKLRHKLYAWIDEQVVECCSQATVTRGFIDRAKEVELLELDSYLEHLKKNANRILGSEAAKYAKEETYDTLDSRIFQYRVLVLK